MTRKRSSTSQYGPAAFTAEIGGVPISSYQKDVEEPFSTYTTNICRPSKVQCTGSGKPSLAVMVYEDPRDFLTSINGAQRSLSQTVPVSSHHRPRRNSHHLPSSPRQAPMFNSTLFQSPATPTTGELTTATTHTSAAMSRQASTTGSSFCGGLDKLKLNTPASDGSTNDGNSTLDLSPSPNSEPSVQMFEADRSYLVGHAGGMVEDAESRVSAVPGISMSFPPHFVEDTCMKRSSSTETNSSTQSRISRRSQEQGILSSRPLKPKAPSTESISKEPASYDHRHIITSEDGSSKEVVSIPKAPYVRPAHHKVMCNLCDDQPQGFRGEHELRRHTERKHSPVRKAWVCMDISEGNKFLANCKKCTRGKKYNAYYNAAAHLRRTHFNPKQKGGKGKLLPKEKRGGKGGGDQPSMDTLKLWMKEIDEVVVPNLDPRGSDEDNDDNEDDGFVDSSGETAEEVNTQSGLGSCTGPTPIGNIARTNKIAETASLFPSSSSVQFQQYDNSLQLTTSAANSADIFDLSLPGSSMNANNVFFSLHPQAGSSVYDNPDFPYENFCL